mmetsp:Transcript_2358/g.4423  ORF Transcript_2358/g.4423 Transcript_2358/m.4423 type:complete len:273 (+) Transcript_2358:729-1547(+)
MLKQQLITGPAWPMYCPLPSAWLEEGLKKVSSPLPHAHKISDPVGPVQMLCTGAASVRDPKGRPVPTSQRRTDLSRLVDTTVCCRPRPGKSATDVTASECPAQLRSGCGICSAQMSAMLWMCTFASADAETKKVSSSDTINWVTSRKCAGQLLSRAPVLVCHAQMLPDTEPPKQNAASAVKVIAVIFSGRLPLKEGFFSPHAQTCQSALFACTAKMLLELCPTGPKPCGWAATSSNVATPAPERRSVARIPWSSVQAAKTTSTISASNSKSL